MLSQSIESDDKLFMKCILILGIILGLALSPLFVFIRACLYIQKNSAFQPSWPFLSPSIQLALFSMDSLSTLAIDLFKIVDPFSESLSVRWSSNGESELNSKAI